jgi:4-amino-4-deoxy-L-arabinose transferase-like glycosyltransferase
MMLFQLAWLAGAWATGAVTNLKVPVLIIYTLFFGILIAYGPGSLENNVRQWQTGLFRDEKRLIIGFCFFIFAVGLVYAYYQRIWTFDEEGAYAASQLIAQQGLAEFFDNYVELSWLGSQHPPLIMLINGLVLRIFGDELFYLRITTLVFALGTIVLTYLIGSSLYDRKTGVFAAIFVASFPLFMRLGTAAMLDMQVTFFAVLAVYLVILLERQQSYTLAVAAGIILGLGLLSKYTMILIYPVILSYFLVRRSFKRSFPRLVVLGLVSGFLLLVWLVFAYQQGVISAQESQLGSLAGVTTNRAHSGSLSPFLMETLISRLPSAIGTFAIPVILLGLFSLWQSRRKADLFVFLWVLLVSLVLILTLPDHRYFMIMFPALAIIMGLAVRRIPQSAPQVVLLTLIYWAGVLYLFVDWSREVHLFLGGG